MSQTDSLEMPGNSAQAADSKGNAESAVMPTRDFEAPAACGTSRGSDRAKPLLDWPASVDLACGAVSQSTWRLIERGLAQRAHALNEFLRDIYFEQKIVRAGAVPLRVVSESAGYLPQMIEFEPPGATYFHAISFEVACVAGKLQVLSQSLCSAWECLRIPQKRESCFQSIPALYAHAPIMHPDKIPEAFLGALEKIAVAPAREQPSIWVLSQGESSSGNSRERRVANMIGTGALQPGDIEISAGNLAARTIHGSAPINILLRLSPDSFLDPLMFGSSAHGVPGLLDIYRSGKVAVIPAPGSGIADELAVFSCMPEIVEFYTGDAPVIPNRPLWRCNNEADKRFVLGNLRGLAIRKANDASANPIHLGVNASAAQFAAIKDAINAEGSDCIAYELSPDSCFPHVNGMPTGSSKFVLRAFVAGTASGYRALPGGSAFSARSNHAERFDERDLWILDE